MAITIDRPSSGRGHFDLRELHSAPERSMQQRVVALALANDVRSGRAQLKRDLKAGRQQPSAVLFAPPPWAENMKVLDMLMALPGTRQIKALALLRRCDISAGKTIGALTERQRTRLYLALGRRR